MLKKENRLLKSADFSRVLGRGRAVVSGFFLLKYAKTDNSRTKRTERSSYDGNSRTRIGFVISAKVSKKAVERNLLKRRIREIIRRNANMPDSGYDIVFVARRSALSLTFSELRDQVLIMLGKIK